MILCPLKFCEGGDSVCDRGFCPWWGKVGMIDNIEMYGCLLLMLWGQARKGKEV